MGFGTGLPLFGCVWDGLSDLPFREDSLWRISTLLLQQQQVR
jgi:hypothetical protein